MTNPMWVQNIKCSPVLTHSPCPKSWTPFPVLPGSGPVGTARGPLAATGHVLDGSSFRAFYHDLGHIKQKAESKHHDGHESSQVRSCKHWGSDCTRRSVSASWSALGFHRCL